MSKGPDRNNLLTHRENERRAYKSRLRSGWEQNYIEAISEAQSGKSARLVDLLLAERVLGSEDYTVFADYFAERNRPRGRPTKQKVWLTATATNYQEAIKEARSDRAIRLIGLFRAKRPLTSEDFAALATHIEETNKRHGGQSQQKVQTEKQATLLYLDRLEVAHDLGLSITPTVREVCLDYGSHMGEERTRADETELADMKEKIRNLANRPRSRLK